MGTAIEKAWQLIISADAQLLDIIGVTLRMTILSSCISLILGLFIGMLYGCGRFPFRRALIVLNRVLMGLPPVVCGLICYLLFSGVGPLRHFRLLYTVKGMVIAQTILLTPIVVGYIETYISGRYDAIRETAYGLALPRYKIFALTVSESRYAVLSTYLYVFGRAMAEVGAVSMVGGAIAFKTNVMSTAIMMYTNMGDFTLGIALGLILLMISLVINLLGYIVERVTS